VDPRTPNACLAIDGVTLAYGRKTVVESLTLVLPRGGIGCLLGPSGCGKTTVLRAVAGFEPVVEGTIRLDGYGSMVLARQRSGA